MTPNYMVNYFAIHARATDLRPPYGQTTFDDFRVALNFLGSVIWPEDLRDQDATREMNKQHLRSQLCAWSEILHARTVEVCSHWLEDAPADSKTLNRGS